MCYLLKIFVGNLNNCEVTGHCTPLRPVEEQLIVGGSEEILPVHAAKIEDPCLYGIVYAWSVY